MLTSEVLFLIIFILLVLGILVFDLLIIGRKSHIVSFGEALTWSFIWISTAVAFYFMIRYLGEKIHGINNMQDLQHVVSTWYPELILPGENYDQDVELLRKTMSINYITGYLIEETLSIDNLFVIFMILTAFSVNLRNYKPVLFWGILGAVVLRFIFIFAGAALIQRFDWILLVFGGWLVYQGIKMFIQRNKETRIEPQNNKLVQFLSRNFNVFPRYVGRRFFIRKNNRLFITPLFIVVVYVEFSDVIFAFDSIPAIFSVTRDPYVVFFSNIFAIIGLRSLFFLLIRIINMFHYLKTGISILLAFIGFKLLFHHWLDHIGYKSIYSLYFILFILAGSIIMSVLHPKKTIISRDLTGDNAYL